MSSKIKNITVVEFPPGQIEPLFVAARDVPKVIIGVSKSTLSNWRSLRRGPAFTVVQGSVYYPWQELKEFFGGGKVQTHNGDMTS